MPAKKYVVKLKAAEREQLEQMLRGGECQVRQARRAQILLAADEGHGQEALAGVLHVSRGTVQRVSQRYCEEGLEAALTERPRPGGQPKLDAKAQAHLVALACSEAPDGRECWTLQLLADKLVQLQVVDSLSYETVRRMLKKTSSSPGARSSGASPK